MKWDEGHRSADVIDRRGQRRGGALVGRLGLGGVVLVGLLSVLLKRNLFTELSGPTGATPAAAPSPAEDRLAAFVGFTLDDAQDTWTKLLPPGVYRRAKLVLFTDSTSSACGIGQAAMGPFYCPADEQVYIDLGFYEALRSRLGAPGDFAQAYVIGHEIGHHVQNLLGTERRLREAQRQRGSDRNALSVRMELQADCYAGVWAHGARKRGLLEGGDVEEALGAAAAIGDDRLQGRAGRATNPETWTHGSSEQRTTWFRRGLEAGSPDSCDTFQAPRL